MDTAAWAVLAIIVAPWALVLLVALVRGYSVSVHLYRKGDRNADHPGRRE